MPCRNDWTPEELRENEERSKQNRERKERWEEHQRENDPPPKQSSGAAMREDAYVPSFLLCEAMTRLEEVGELCGMSDELLEWYREHESGERDRVLSEARESFRKGLPLSVRERRILDDDTQTWLG